MKCYFYFHLTTGNYSNHNIVLRETVITIAHAWDDSQGGK